MFYVQFPYMYVPFWHSAPNHWSFSQHLQQNEDFFCQCKIKQYISSLDNDNSVVHIVKAKIWLEMKFRSWFLFLLATNNCFMRIKFHNFKHSHTYNTHNQMYYTNIYLVGVLVPIFMFISKQLTKFYPLQYFCSHNV